MGLGTGGIILGIGSEVGTLGGSSALSIPTIMASTALVGYSADEFKTGLSEFRNNNFQLSAFQNLMVSMDEFDREYDITGQMINAQVALGPMGFAAVTEGLVYGLRGTSLYARSLIASKKSFRDMMSPEEAAKYDKYWTKKAPVESTPYSTYRRYDEAGDIKQVTTYDKYGNRQTQFDLKDSRGRDPHRHDFKYDQNHPRPSYGARDKDHKPLDNIPDY